MSEPRPIDNALGRMLTRRAGLPSTPDLEAVFARVNLALSEGDLCLRLEAKDLSQVQAAPSMVVRSSHEDRVTPLVLDDDRLYLDRCWEDETLLVREFTSRAKALSGLSAAAAASLVQAAFKGDPVKEACQRRAVELALTRRFALITGGPGTGKTTVIRQLLHGVLQTGQRPRVALAAPTGKAADRLREQVGDVDLPIETSTLHSLLGVRNLEAEDYRRGPHDPICADWVIVDEASMVDARQMARLLGAVPPGTSLVLLGDPDQLQSVQSGAVLGDVCRATGPVRSSIAELDHNWRAEGQGIQQLAQAIRRGDSDACGAVLDAHPDVERVQGNLAGLLKGRVIDAWKDLARLPAEGALQRLRGLRLLCAHRHGPAGVSHVNRLVESWLELSGHIKPGKDWYEGRPVMVRRNDYGLDLRNGNTAVIRGGQAVFDLPNHPAFPPSLLPEHETCYATTVHKAQGSEGEEVVVILPDEASRLLTKEMLYTAVTRASKKVTLVGSHEVLAKAVKNPTKRVSGLTERLKA